MLRGGIVAPSLSLARFHETRDVYAPWLESLPRGLVVSSYFQTTFAVDYLRVVEGKTANAVKAMDSFDAARVLLVPNHLREGEAVAAAIPDRDTLFLAPLPADGDWNGMRKLARTRGGSGYHLLNQPLKITRDGFEIA